MVAPHLQRAAAEAARLGLQVVIGDAPTELFAGLGEVEPPAPAADRLEEHP